MTRQAAARAALLPLLAPLAACAGRPATTAPAPAAALDAFVVAHPDDWQLFMGDIAMDAVRAGRRVVLVYATTGDAGIGEEYWRARERGAIASAAFLMGVAPPDSANLLAGGTRPAACADVTLEGRTVHRCALGTTVSYFLRLPDGNVNGSGFAATGMRSLASMAAGGAPMTPLSGTGTYATRADLATVVAGAIRAESRAGALAVRVHATDPDSTYNPGEHADHREAALAAADAATRAGWPIVHYASYSTARRPTNLDAERFGWKAGLFLAYDRARILAKREWSAYCESPIYSEWLSRTYPRPAAAAGRD